ncbi:hypothetical protein ACFLRF_01450 [Candidatus Altiarchaeota archaeon]
MRTALILAMMIVVSGCTQAPDPLEDCLKMQNSFEKDGCILKMSEKSTIIDLCENIDSRTDGMLCQKNIAVNRRESTKCEDIMDQTISAECTTEVAVATGNYMLCKKIDRQSKRTHCEYRVSSAKRKQRLEQ